MRLPCQAACALIVAASWLFARTAGTSADELSSNVVVFNQDAAKAHRAGEQWTTTPRQVAVEFLGTGCECHKRIISQSGTSDPKVAIITVIDDGLDDDSVGAMRNRLRLRLTNEGFWNIQTVTKSWRCWPERGHQDFSTVLCN